jgi:hypothetical protein
MIVRHGVGQELVPLDRRDRWAERLEGIDHAFAHTWESCHAMHQTTGHPTSLYCFEADGIRAVVPLAEREYEGAIDVVTPYGMSGFAANGEHPAFLDAWDSFTRERGWVCGYIGLNPLLERSGFSRPDERYTHNEIYVLDLNRDELVLASGLSENRRRQIRAWRDGPFALTRDRTRLAEFVHVHAADFFRSRGASGVYSFTATTWQSLSNAPNVIMLGAEREGAIVAVTLLAHATRVGDYLFNFSTDDGTEASAPLLWFGALELRALGVTRLNLGGGIRHGDGVASFKQRFGARALPLPALKQVYDPGRYELLCKNAGANPADRSGFFPPYRAPRTP